MPCRGAPAIGAANGWKHFTRQVPISGQAFWGQLGQGLAGLWQGISSAAEVAVIGPAMAKAIDVVIGTVMSAPSMATMPRRADQRWAALFLTRSRLPHLRQSGKNTPRGPPALRLQGFPAFSLME
jgi:hypothetical protein